MAFDAEEKGDSAAQWWLSHLDNAKRLRPWWKDANQMLQDGADLRKWIIHGLEHIQMPEPVIPVLDIPDTCATCGRHINDVEDFYYTNEGIGYCLTHCPASPPSPQAKPTGSYEQFLGVVEQLATVFPKGCTIHTDDPAGYTLAQHVEKLQEQEHKRYHEMFVPNSQKRHWHSERRM